MTGIRERLSILSDDDVASPVNDEMGFLETPIGVDGGPNESFELREMVAVASAYLTQGLLDDAEELLREVLDAGYSRPDAVDLQIRVLEARGGSIEPMPEPGQLELIADQLPLIAFTNPLPGADRLPLSVQRLIRESDADLRAGRWLAALDAALYVIGSAPEYYPMFVRLAEIELALGRFDAAQELTATLTMCLKQSATGQEWLLYPIRLALDPEDESTLVEYARHLLDHPGQAPLDPFVPNAIVRVISSDPATAQELAREYFKAMPLSDSALRLYLRSAVANGDRESVVSSITANVRPDSGPDLLVLRAAVGASRSREEWIDWLERAASIQQSRPASRVDVAASLELVARMLQPARAALTAGVMFLAEGDAIVSRKLVEQWRQATAGRALDRIDQFTASCIDAMAAAELGAADSLEALLVAANHSLDVDVRTFADSCRLFSTSVGPAELLKSFVDASLSVEQSLEAIESLQLLRDRHPEALEIREALADLCLQQRRVAEGVRELRYVAEQRDAAGDVPGMVAAMRRISEALPTNAEAKSKIIDSYLHRGVLDEAMTELEALGELHATKGRRHDAVTAFSRGADVAAAVGNFKRATDFYDAAVLVEPDSDAVRHAAVAFFLRIGAVDRAVRQLWEVVRIAMHAHDPDEAVAALHQIIALTPQDPAAYHKLGEVLASLGEYSQAEKVYRRLSGITPDDPVLAAKQAALSALATKR